ncbi:hypothetical protein [Paenibacillus amylolyticus]
MIVSRSTAQNIGMIAITWAGRRFWCMIVVTLVLVAVISGVRPWFVRL